MPAPRVFVSSTYYDLRHVREVVRDFIRGFGYEPVLFEDSDILYQPDKSVEASCLEEVRLCDMCVLIIGQRYGSAFPDDRLSVTHREYLEADAADIPIFAFVDAAVLEEFKLWKLNRDAKGITYGTVGQDVGIFELAEDVMGRAESNALVPFRSIGDILTHLQKQWAAMFKKYALDERRQRREDRANLARRAALQDVLDAHKRLPEFVRQLSLMGLPPLTADAISKHDTLRSFLEREAASIREHDTDIRAVFGGKVVNVGREVLESLEEDYGALKRLDAEALDAIVTTT